MESSDGINHVTRLYCQRHLSKPDADDKTHARQLLPANRPGRQSIKKWTEPRGLVAFTFGMIFTGLDELL